MKKYTKEQIESITKQKDLKMKKSLIKLYDSINKHERDLTILTEKLNAKDNPNKNFFEITENEVNFTVRAEKAFKHATSKQIYFLKNNTNVNIKTNNFGYLVNRINVKEASKLIDLALQNKTINISAICKIN